MGNGQFTRLTGPLREVKKSLSIDRVAQLDRALDF